MSTPSDRCYYVIAALLLLTLAACSSSTSQASAPSTVLVTNASCNPGPCRTLQVRAQDETYTAPHPGAFLGFPLGYVGSASGCLTFPPWTTGYRYSLADSFTLIARDILTLDPTPPTGTFVPQDGPGWSVTFDTAPVSPSGPVAMATACTPRALPAVRVQCVDGWAAARGW